MSKLPKVSIIIVTYNKRDILRLCLESLLNTKYDNFDVVVIDNGSSDKTSDYIKMMFPSIKLVRLDRNIGHAAGCNVGIHISKKAKYIVKLDDDVIILDKDWLKKAVNLLERDPKIAAAHFNIISVYVKNIDEINTKIKRSHCKLKNIHRKGTYLLIDRLGFGVLTTQTNVIAEVFFPGTVACIFRRKALIEAGGFDNDFFFYLDEVDIGWRLRLLGYKILIIPQIYAYHIRFQYSMQKMPFISIYNYSKNTFMMFIKNYSLINIIKYLPIKLLFFFLESLYMLYKNPIAFYACIYGLLYIIKKMKLILIKRYNVQKMRRIGDSEIIKFMIPITPLSSLIKAASSL